MKKRYVLPNKTKEGGALSAHGIPVEELCCRLQSNVEKHMPAIGFRQLRGRSEHNVVLDQL